MPISTPGQPSLQNVIQKAFQSVRDMEAEGLSAKQLEESNKRIEKLSQELSKAIDDHISKIVVTVGAGIKVVATAPFAPQVAVPVGQQIGETIEVGTSDL